MSGMSLTIELTRTEPADTAFSSTVLTASFTDAPVNSSKETALVSGISDFIIDSETTFSALWSKLICVIIVSFGIACLFKFSKSTVLYKSKEFELTTAGSNISSLFSKLGISFDSVCQILLNQRVDDLNLMFNSSDNNIVSYKSL